MSVSLCFVHVSTMWRTPSKRIKRLSLTNYQHSFRRHSHCNLFTLKGRIWHMNWAKNKRNLSLPKNRFQKRFLLFLKYYLTDISFCFCVFAFVVLLFIEYVIMNLLFVIDAISFSLSPFRSAIWRPNRSKKSDFLKKRKRLRNEYTQLWKSACPGNNHTKKPSN